MPAYNKRFGESVVDKSVKIERYVQFDNDYVQYGEKVECFEIK